MQQHPVEAGGVVARQGADDAIAEAGVEGEGGLVVHRGFQAHAARAGLTVMALGGEQQRAADALAAELGRDVDGDDMAAVGAAQGEDEAGEDGIEPAAEMEPARGETQGSADFALGIGDAGRETALIEGVEGGQIAKRERAQLHPEYCS